MSILNNLLLAFEKNKDDPFLRYGIAIEYRNAGQKDKALEFFTGVYEKFPDYIPNYYHFALALEAEEQKEHAIKVCSEGIIKAETAGNMHAASELRRALDQIEIS